jgi:glycosyltransferase involved in cell wall biosynthesis
MMHKAGHNVRVITYSFYNDAFFDKYKGDVFYREFTYKGIPVTAIKHKRIPENLHFLLEDKSMTDLAMHLISKEKPDLVHVGHPMRVGEFIKSSKFFAIPYIITLTDFWLICCKGILVDSKKNLCTGPLGCENCRLLCTELPYELIRKRYDIAEDILFSAEKVISPSKFVAGMFKKEFKDLNVKVINHGMSYRSIKLNTKFYKKDDKLIFCYAGSLNYHKGVHILIDAFKKIKSQNITLKIYGSGSDEVYINRLRALAEDDKRIEFCGVFSEDQVGDIFHNIDVAVVPSLWYENYPLVLHEALACNVPVIASNVGGMAEKIKDRFNGYLFKIGDSGHLREIIEKIIKNQEILNEFKNNIKSFMIPTIEQEAYAYEREYNAIIKGIKNLSNGVCSNSHL